jgi:hypothetical protein
MFPLHCWPPSSPRLECSPSEWDFRFSGRVNLDRRQAINRARTLIEKAGYRLEQVGADLDPSEVEKPFKSGKDTIAFYSIDWLDVRGNPGVTIKLNAESGQMVGMELWSRTTWMPPSTEETALIHSVRAANPARTRANPEYARELWPVMRKALAEYAGKLGLPVLAPVEKAHVQKIVFRGLARGPVAEIVMTNGWSFGFYGSGIRWYESGDCLWKRSKPPLYPSEFEGAAKLSERQAEEIVRATVGK